MFLLFSCGVPTIKGLPEYNVNLSQFINPYFANVNTDYVYKAKLNVYDKVFGGILIIKKLKENNHRIVFTTNFGNKIFDFEFIENDFKTHFIMEEINRKIIINILKRDFQILTQENNNVNRAFKKGSQFDIYQTKINHRFNHYVVDSQTKELIKIINSTQSKEKIIITFDNVQNSIAENIQIQHKNIPINIDLTFLNNH